MPKFNKTHLSLDLAETRGILHRDYLAHCLRWSHAFKVALQVRQDLRVLDIGCGKEFPFAKTLYVNKLSPKRYLGVDVNKLELPVMLADKPWFEAKSIDAASMDLDWQPTLVICFEVVEHMPFAHVQKLLANVRRLMHLDGRLLLSTPAWNGEAAGNHPNEMRYEVMGSLLEAAGFGIEHQYGTFASIRDYKTRLTELGYLELFNRLAAYYDTNVLAVIFAPIIPELSRNVLWNCTRGPASTKFLPLDQIQRPWGNDPEVQ